MNTKAYDILNERGLIKQVNHEEDVKHLLNEKSTTFYIGFDPTADSLHVGHFVSMMIMANMQRAGHKPIVLIGGGTAMVGDPSGKTDMRKMLTKEQIGENVKCLKEQMSKFLNFDGENGAIIVNNADWLLSLNYVDFLRDIGVHFSVNRMLSAECFKQRLEKGLSFLEFNYMLMQGYDFLRLFEDYDCKLQLGGDDQWSNVLAGTDLIRKIHRNNACCLTFPLLLTSEGKKMGKTEAGALWLDKNKTSIYDFYQYWRNVSDSDVGTVLRMLTFLTIEEIRDLEKLEGAEINKAKEIAAFEITKIVHGEEEAMKVQEAAKKVFEQGSISENMPTTEISKEDISNMTILDLLVKTNLAPSKGQARILVSQGGIYINDKQITDIGYKIVGEIQNNDCIIRKGKKNFNRVVVK